MTFYNCHRDWRCPYCGGQDIEVNVIQKWRTVYEIDNGIPSTPWADQTLGGPDDITQILCLSCNAEDDDDKYWHMSEREWHEELKAREGDYLMDLRRGT